MRPRRRTRAHSSTTTSSHGSLISDWDLEEVIQELQTFAAHVERFRGLAEARRMRNPGAAPAPWDASSLLDSIAVQIKSVSETTNSDDPHLQALAVYAASMDLWDLPPLDDLRNSEDTAGPAEWPLAVFSASTM